MDQRKELIVLELVQSLEKGGRTVRFSDTVEGLRDNKIKVIPLCLSKPSSWVDIPELITINRSEGKNFTLVFKLIKLIKKEKVSLVHAHCEFSQLYAGLAAKLTGVPIIGTFHRSDLSRYTPSMSNRLIQWCLDRYIAVSKNRLSMLTENLRFDSRRCEVVHGGTKVSELPTQELVNKTKCLLNVDDENLVLFSCGHLGPIKGHQDTIKACSLLKQQNIQFKLYIAGDGSSQEKTVLEELISSLSLENDVQLLGQVDNVNEWMLASDIFVQPSVEEAFGLVFIEAGARGLPVVATRVGGITEIIEDKVSGILVPPRAPTELFDALLVLCQDSEMRQVYGKTLYKRICDKFSIASMVKSYLNVFKSCQ